MHVYLIELNQIKQKCLDITDFKSYFNFSNLSISNIRLKHFDSNAVNVYQIYIPTSTIDFRGWILYLIKVRLLIVIWR